MPGRDEHRSEEVEKPPAGEGEMRRSQTRRYKADGFFAVSRKPALHPLVMCFLPSMSVTNPNPTLIPGLRSPYDTTGDIVYFGRMLDKIRLHAQGLLPDEWVKSLGEAYPSSFDSRCCRFLALDYDALRDRVLTGGSDEEILEWAFAQGRRPGGDEVEIWNAFMTKRGWRDAGTQRLQERLAEIGLPPDAVSTMFDFIDLDEGRRVGGMD